jgi:hypothetical protein
MSPQDVYLRDYETPAEARLGLGRYLAYYNHQRRHSSLGRRTPASVYGLEVSPADRKVLVKPTIGGMIETGVGCSIAAIAAAAPVALRAPAAAAAGPFATGTIPPYLRRDSVQHMGTS